MDKNDLRKKYLNIRANSKYDVSTIHNKLFSLQEFKNAETVFTYVSVGNEIDTYEIIKKCFELGKKVAIPKCIGDNLEFYYINSINDLKEGSFNIPEPTTNIKATNFQNSICITPGVVFDRKGFRIGYGKGFYDRFFKAYTGYKIGLCTRDCVITELSAQPHDIAVDIVIF